MACLDGTHNLGKIEGSTFVFYPNAENQSKPKKFKENVEFQSMANALSRLAS